MFVEDGQILVATLITNEAIDSQEQSSEVGLLCK